MFAIPHTTGQVADDPTHESEEPPDETLRSVAGQPLEPNFTKAVPRRAVFSRRESLLTKQLHASETESHTEDEHSEYRASARAHSTSSMAELTSDNDLTSPGTRGSSPSPTFPPVRSTIAFPSMDKHTVKEPVIMEQDESPRSPDKNEKAVETGLGRRRCITFACGKKANENKEIAKPSEKPAQSNDTTPPKRKCAITFACPTRTKPAPQKLSSLSTRHMSPAPKSPRSPRVAKQHRGSESTITSSSPSTLRKVPSLIRRRNKYADDADEDKLESKRFHEFAVDAHADEDWTEEVTCHRKRLTVRDTLHKENVIRKMGEEVEEEAEDEDELNDEAILDGMDEDDEMDEDDDEEVDDEEDEDDHDQGVVIAQAGDTISDCGFDTDDEGGFANDSESDGEDSDFEWWAPGRSTAATSTDALEHIRPSHHRKMSDSSLESAREANGATIKANKKSRAKSAAVKINRPPTPELPDSTDFVCGTLDEDRPLEQAYISAMALRKAAKYKVTPQDIDPTFPTSDPEMDEEDEEDDVDQDDDEDDDSHLFMHGNMDLNDDRGRRGSHHKAHTKKRSPHQSPRRLRSPPPAHRIMHRSPPPPVRRSSIRSPPAACTRGRLRSPPPHKLFGHSPKRLRSPPPSNRPTSPPNSRSTSVDGTPTPVLKPRNSGLGSRPQLTQTASLPRVPTMTKIQNLNLASQDDDEDNDENGQDLHERKAIDIVKGLEKKRQRRKEKLYQKHCQKNKKEGEKKCKPGKGAERMRELGLELAAYRGNKAEHMLSY
ncbi:hypothetical protein C1H76_0345 [Elsinoe australis]|uniref:Extensin domain-containing protein n=1 Tax=Elsinoe australis TaxID=40998 RepID=A0A4U7B7R1_9PEZI|nr:hypothetical protein C1H76_0345 [Elsinoe australis]